MKKAQFLFAFMFICSLSYGQVLRSGLLIKDLDAKYIEVTIRAKKMISLNYGQKGGRDDVVTEDGKKFFFNNHIHIINFFYKNEYDVLFEDLSDGIIRFIKFDEVDE